MKIGLLVRSIFSVLALPVMVTGALPAYILNTRGYAIGAGLPMPLNIIVAGVGLAVAAVGLFLAAGSMLRFFSDGDGTLAPWDPPRKLVVHGMYRYVRNPMISGVLSLVLGEAIFFGSKAIFEWFVFFAALNAVYMPLWEEPGLVARFGDDYREYQHHVPRWLPRLTPWQPGAQ
ncbi:MAG TPA: isoprenylcysteine carboxylmethyltransferase family protein [Candidatus Binataceae bacterium]|nr:isoprenylcysteine carboxylmethyltransferase family protein [Candidatus Binataceae bacterium]